MNKSYEASILREFKKIVEKGLIYRGEKPIFWCISCKTALAEAEVEYKEEKTPSIYVKFPIIDKAFYDNSFIIIWTTTPWTIPANLAIAVNPEFEYILVSVDSEKYLLAKEKLENCSKLFNWSEYEIIKSFKGNELEGLTCKHPYLNRESKVVLGTFVSLEYGTGCVHIAPGHGEDDYIIGLKYGLKPYSPIDDSGVFTKDVEFFAGKNVFEANPLICEKLKEENKLLLYEEITHSYPHCWRCKNPVIFRTTKQWFICLDKNNLRERAYEEIKKVKWIPHWGEKRISGMLLSRPDWCISRQRSWGVPIIAFYCKNCKEILLEPEIINYIADIVEREGTDVWFRKDVKELLPEGIKCRNCGSSEFIKEKDILDVWVDSGTSYAAVLEKNEDLSFPADLYLEGSDQHRGWFHSSLLLSVATREKAPYKAVLTHGFVVDGKGRKMSKSLGNVISPQEIINKYGAEILRLWVSSEDYKEDIKISKDILNRLVEAYRKIRNTARFILGNLYDFNPDEDKISYENLKEIDKWILHKLQKLIEKVKNAYENYDFHVIYHQIYNFCVVDLSALYLDIAKDRLYVEFPSSYKRRAAQTTLFEIILTLVKLISPILSFTAEEIWRYIPSFSGKEKSVFLTDFPEVKKEFLNEELFQKWEYLFKIRDEVLKALEIARQKEEIGHSLDAQVTIYAPESLLEFLKNYEKELAEVFIVSDVKLSNLENNPLGVYISEEFDGLFIYVEKAKGEKCERCWMYSTSVGKNEKYKDVCERCAKVLEKLERRKVKG